jgi:hypothetical protein
MTFKSTLTGTLITLVALALSAVGCSGGDECTLAAEHLVDCLNPTGSPTSSTPTAAAKCNGATVCVAACVNRTECPALQEAFNGGTSAAATEFLTCTQACQEP